MNNLGVFVNFRTDQNNFELSNDLSLFKCLSAIIDKFKGGPVGINTIATAVSEEAGTIEEVYEPFLIKEGFLQRTARGREATELAYKHLNKDQPLDNPRLF